jgi:hypothetical protein
VSAPHSGGARWAKTVKPRACFGNPSLNLRVYQLEEERAMVMTTLEVRKTLTVLERLVVALELRRVILDADEKRLLLRLEERRSTLRRLVAAREAELEKKIVSFALWRDETLPDPALEPQLGASAI